jgi:4-hydroxy-3-polyprenylbenzoate decarboxylase
MIDEYLFAGIIRGESVEVVKCVTNDLLVPAHAEIVLEGWCDLEETRWEGPFGDHTGYYSLADFFPVFHVEAITMRRDPIYPTTIVGPPPMEDDYIAKATERLFLPVIKAMMPEVVDYDMPLEGVFHNCVIFQIKKEFAGQAFRVMNFAWSMGQMMFTKFVIVVDEDVDCHDYSQVAWRCFNNVDPGRDIQISKGPLDRLDHSSNQQSFGYKMGIDATKPLPGEGHEREWPDSLSMPPEVLERIDEMWGELGL